MVIKPLVLETEAVIPVMAALPYAVSITDPEAEQPITYDPRTQLSIIAGRRDFSTCREDESVWGLFTSKSDTKKDD
jgi:hypothetical protein